MKISIQYDGDPANMKIVNDENGEQVENVISATLECASKLEGILTVKFSIKSKRHPLEFDSTRLP